LSQTYEIMKTTFTRRQVIQSLGLGTAGLMLGQSPFACSRKTHIITLSFDDGFEKSSIKTAEIFEKYGLSACINVIATAHLKNFILPNEYHAWKAGDFQLWNELKSRGHEIMPHSYDHQNLTEMPLEQAKESILKCLDIFNKELKDFNAKESVYNFAYNASSPEIEEWLGTQVKGFRTGGPALNPLPYPGQKKLTCISHGPENIDQNLGETIDQFLEGPQGWFIFNTHGLDDEGWGPVSSVFLDELLDRLTKIKTLEILPAGKVLARI
jgi:peptidoglycan/xylan/chitin deacetylase (PgdA/CDA1 family)